MKRIGAVLAAALSLGAAGSCLAAPLEVYGKLPSLEQVAISADGQYLAISATDGEQRNVIIERVSDHQMVAAIRAGASKLRNLQWAGSNHVLLTLSVHSGLGDDIAFGTGEHWGVIDFNLTTKKQRVLLSDMPGAVNTIGDLPQTRIIDGKPIVYLESYYFSSDEGASGDTVIFRVDLDKGQTKVVASGMPHARGFLINDAGDVIAQSLYDATTSKWTLRVRSGSDWRLAKTVIAPIERPGIAGLASDGHSILLWDHKDGEPILREMAVDAQDWGAPIHDGDAALLTDPTTGALAGFVTEDEDGDHYEFVDAKRGLYWRAAAAAYPGQQVTLQDASADGRKLVILVDSPTEGPAFALVDLEAKHASWIGPQYGVHPQDIGEKRAIAFKAADGLDLTGYVTLPPGRPAKALPLVVLAHGGPEARDDPGFDWWAQAIASRGYAVLQVNYRGSDGFGWKFVSAGFGQWGRKMQTDLSDGVRYLAGQGLVDPKRVCIAGGSYGGYAALAGATLDTGVYRCAASIAGPSDLSRMVGDQKYEQGAQGVGVERYWSCFMGAKDAKDPVLHDISPAMLADRVSIPILLIHGKDDTVVPFEQSTIMADALKTAHKPYQFVTLKHEDHWLSRGETRLEMLQALTAFLEKNNPPG
ncbi:MAG: S9 family peptidase [Proteobacteria bacterium]|nr:S9 family peptidase [Pseudomonadota bacterium]